MIEVRRFLVAAAASAAAVAVAALIAIDLGAISLLVELFGLQVLQDTWVGLLLILLATGFFGAELLVGGTGALALAGAGSFAVGALMLFDPTGDALHVSLPVALGAAVGLAILSAFIGTKITRAAQSGR